MSRGTKVGFFVGGIVLATIGAAPPTDEGPKWVTDYARAREVARASGKPIFLVFRCER